MTLEHVAIWTADLERLKFFYVDFFDAECNQKYVNPLRKFESYFLSFASGARLEIMFQPEIPEFENTHQPHRGITHLAFGVISMAEVDAKAAQLQEAGFPIFKGPRKTGDGYYEFETEDPDHNRLEVTTPYID